MFIIENTYLVNKKEIDNLVPEHRAYMKDLFDKGLFIAMGPQVPRNGGIIISTMSDKRMLINLLEQEPLVINQYVSYRIIEFNPTVVGEKYKFLLGA
ncbi:YciI family protein [Vibrio mangrovi]|uniref:YCII-related domain protein n=1 Tax=Vibrio mangrovi TaxID=474394 RepID=A0A1Y6IQB1_9VIBR|nr:YciI family protein [Vibrio mangrovi]MDW6003386.1 YciI family protein [Vibrio mangrovi]SMR99824.1 YCII-related domain protein [Vibrio mangrovi]